MMMTMIRHHVAGSLAGGKGRRSLVSPVVVVCYKSGSLVFCGMCMCGDGTDGDSGRMVFFSFFFSISQ